ncbi:hypothetical protein CLV59_102530 [Chitinophaga dinghuensis]|uniref:Uncharacterized protein n=2 Tax=Chitinophaga dinghuensis TaxID=1539050 RepID=A0A327W5Z2_9BACT|nr:hypothetical protein CLV59_102530 [Chitinophaga dinghuensis]
MLNIIKHFMPPACIMLGAGQSLNLGEYTLFIKLASLPTCSGLYFSFPHLEIMKGEKVAVYASNGKYQKRNIDGRTIHCLYFGEGSNFWNNPEIKSAKVELAKIDLNSGFGIN